MRDPPPYFPTPTIMKREGSSGNKFTIKMPSASSAPPSTDKIKLRFSAGGGIQSVSAVVPELEPLEPVSRAPSPVAVSPPSLLMPTPTTMPQNQPMQMQMQMQNMHFNQQQQPQYHQPQLQHQQQYPQQQVQQQVLQNQLPPATIAQFAQQLNNGQPFMPTQQQIQQIQQFYASQQQQQGSPSPLTPLAPTPIYAQYPSGPAPVAAVPVPLRKKTLKVLSKMSAGQAPSESLFI